MEEIGEEVSCVGGGDGGGFRGYGEVRFFRGGGARRNVRV